MQTQKWVNLGLLALGTLAFLFLSRFFGLIWNIANLPAFEGWPVEPVYILSFVVALALVFFIYKSEKANGFLNEVASEG